MIIEKNVPLPSSADDKVKTFRSMKIGDSFLVSEDVTNWRLAMSRAHADGSRHFISRAVDGGVRFWRKA